MSSDLKDVAPKPRPATLYDGVDAYRAVMEWLDEHEEEIAANGGEIPAALAEHLDAIDEAIERKVDALVAIYREHRLSADAAEAEVKRLRTRQAHFEGRAEALREYIYACLRARNPGHVKHKSHFASVWEALNGRPSIRPADPDHIPEAFQRVPPVEFDGDAAYGVVKGAGLIPPTKTTGPVPLEELGLVIERGAHLRIS